MIDRIENSGRDRLRWISLSQVKNKGYTKYGICMVQEQRGANAEEDDSVKRPRRNRVSEAATGSSHGWPVQVGP